MRVSLRSTPLVPSLLQGPAAKGHPWPIAALAASMPLNPLRNDSTRPPDGAFGVVWEIGVLGAQQTVGAGLPAMLLLLLCFCLSLCLPQIA